MQPVDDRGPQPVSSCAAPLMLDRPGWRLGEPQSLLLEGKSHEYLPSLSKEAFDVSAAKAIFWFTLRQGESNVNKVFACLLSLHIKQVQIYRDLLLESSLRSESNSTAMPSSLLLISVMGKLSPSST